MSKNKVNLLFDETKRSVPNILIFVVKILIEQDFSDFEATMQFIDQLDFLNKSERILEIGSGSGNLSKVLSSKGLSVISSDINLNYLRHDLSTIVQFSGENIPFKSNCFDFVVSIETFEHIPNLDKHLNEIKRILKKGGCYIIQTPNKPFNIVWNIITGNKGWREWHQSLCNYFEIKKLLRKYKFEARFYKIKYFTQYTLSKAKKIVTPFGARVISHINPKNIPVCLYPTFFLVAETKCRC